MRKLLSSAAVVAAMALGASLLGGCASWWGGTDGQGSPVEPAPVVAPEPAYIPPPPPPPMSAPDTGTGAAPDIDRGLPVCPGDPRCKKPGG